MTDECLLVSATVAGVPESVNRIWRYGGSHHYKTAKARSFEQSLVPVLYREKKNKTPYEGAVAMRLVITRKTKRRYDLDNRIKSVQDCLSAAEVIVDDSQVYRLEAEKQQGPEDTTYVAVYKIE